MSKTIKNFIYQILYRILTILTPLITSPYLSRVLGAKCLGIFSATYAYTNYYILFSNLGVELYGSRVIAINDEDVIRRTRSFWNIYAIQFISSLLSLGIYYISIWIGFIQERNKICIYQGIWIIAAGLDINWYFFGRQMFKITVIRNAIVKIITTIAVFFFVKSSTDLNKYTLIMSGGMLISQIVIWIFLMKDIEYCKPDFRIVVKHIKPMIILFIPILASSVFHIMDKTMVDILSDDKNSGFYYNVDRLVNIPLGLVTALSTVMLPKISRLVNENDNLGVKKVINKSCELVSFFIYATSFGLGSCSPEFVPFFWGKEFIPCVSMILAFVPILIFKAFSNFCNQQFLIPLRKDNIYIISVCVGAIMNVIANYFLIKKYNALGAVFGTFLAEGIVLIIEIICTRDYGIGKMILNNYFYFFDGLFMFIFVRILTNALNINGLYGFVLQVIFGALFYCVIACIKWSLDTQSIFYPVVQEMKRKLLIH